MNDIEQLLDSIIADPEGSLQQLQSLGKEKATQLLRQIQELAKTDPKAQQALQALAPLFQRKDGGVVEYLNSLKCGGKVKKAKKGEKGLKAKKGCACVIKKVGGKFIEVDECTGLPTNRERMKSHLKIS